MTRILKDKIDKLEAKLAIAVEALEKMANQGSNDAHAALRRIKEGEPTAETLQALKDCDEGNVTSYADADEFFAGLNEPDNSEDNDVDWDMIEGYADRNSEVSKAILANKNSIDQLREEIG